LRNLSRGQKSWITKQSKTFSEVLKSPGEFSTIKAKSKKHKAQAKSAGLPVTNNRAVVRVGAGGHVRRKGDKIVVTNPERRFDMWFANSKNFEKELARARKRKLKRNQVWGFHIGDRVNNVHYRNLDHLLYYLENKTDWHSEDTTEYISLVLITEGRPDVIIQGTR